MGNLELDLVPDKSDRENKNTLSKLDVGLPQGTPPGDSPKGLSQGTPTRDSPKGFPQGTPYLVTLSIDNIWSPYPLTISGHLIH